MVSYACIAQHTVAAGMYESHGIFVDVVHIQAHNICFITIFSTCETVPCKSTSFCKGSQLDGPCETRSESQIRCVAMGARALLETELVRCTIDTGHFFIPLK